VKPSGRAGVVDRAPPPPEVAFMAPAERVEGTLFGSGERMTVDPRLDLNEVDHIVNVRGL